MRFFSGYPMIDSMKAGMGMGRKKFRNHGGDEMHGGGDCRHHHAHGMEGLSLTDLAPGETAVVIGLNGGETYRKKLLSLGLIPGSMVELVRGGGRGAGILIRLGKSTLMLNAGLADRIAVNPVRN
ncbi:MAG: ferrous iron transport protein A [Spirochaetia bacterium]|nr:ferrous iron transport protein A [Spirochaetia bacterium]